MNIYSIASGSSGNLYVIKSGVDIILIEAGIPPTEMNTELWDRGLRLSDIDDCFITHEHMDHFHSAEYLIKHRTNIYLPRTEAIEDSLKNVTQQDRVIYLEDKQTITVSNFKATALKLEHDGVDILGYLILHKPSDKRLFYATDTAYIKYNPKRVNYFMIEVNYQRKYLEESVKEGDMSRENMRRVMRSHMGLNAALKFFESTDLSQAEEIWIIHTSGRNANRLEIRNIIQSETGIPTFIG